MRKFLALMVCTALGHRWRLSPRVREWVHVCVRCGEKRPAKWTVAKP